MRYLSEILHTFSVKEAAHFSEPPISDHYRQGAQGNRLSCFQSFSFVRLSKAIPKLYTGGVGCNKGTVCVYENHAFSAKDINAQ